MSEKIKKAKESLEKLIEDVAIDSGCAYPALYADIRAALNDFDKYYESQQDLIKSKDEYIAKLCNDRAELKEQLKQVEDFKYHYDRYKKELANNLKAINCMQEEETTNYNLILQLEDRNNKLVERLEKQKAELIKLREERQLLDNLQTFKHFICQGILVAMEQNHTYLQLHLTPELKEWCEKEMNKKVVEKYGN